MPRRLRILKFESLLRTAQETFDLIEGLLPEGVTLRTDTETYALIQSLLDYNDLSNTPTIPMLRDAQATYDLIESLLPEGVTLRTAAQTYTLIRNLIQYADISGTPSIPDITGFITQTVIETLITTAVADFISGATVDSRIATAVVNFISGDTVDSRIQTAIDALTILSEMDVQDVADARALLRYTADEKTKLAGVEAGAEVNRNAQTTYDLIESLLRSDADVQAIADARVEAGTADWAEQGNTEIIPSVKLPALAVDTTLWRGTYADNTAYPAGDIVVYQNDIFLYLSDIPADNTTKPDVDTRAEHLNIGAAMDLISVSSSDNVITFTRRDGETEVITLPAVRTNAEIDARALLRYTATEKNKLAGIESNAKDDQTGSQIVALLTALANNARLSYNALRDTPIIPPEFTLTEESVFDLVKNIIIAGANITVTDDDSDNRIRIAGEAGGVGGSVTAATVLEAIQQMTNAQEDAARIALEANVTAAKVLDAMQDMTEGEEDAARVAIEAEHTLTRERIYDFVKDIIFAGSNVTVTDNDTLERVTIGGQLGVTAATVLAAIQQMTNAQEDAARLALEANVTAANVLDAMQAMSEGEEDAARNAIEAEHTLTRERIYDFVKDIIFAGSNVTVTDNDTLERVTIGGQLGVTAATVLAAIQQMTNAQEDAARLALEANVTAANVLDAMQAMSEGEEDAARNAIEAEHTLTRERIYDFVKDIIFAGSNVTVTDNDTLERVTIGGQLGVTAATVLAAIQQMTNAQEDAARLALEAEHTLTRERIYDFVKDIIVAGDNVTVTDNDSLERVTISATV